MISDRFSERTIEEMEMALEQACAMMPEMFADHQARKFVAERIMSAADGRPARVGDLFAAGRQAVADLASRLARHGS